MGLSLFRASNGLGKPMMCDDPSSVEYVQIMDAIKNSGAVLQ